MSLTIFSKFLLFRCFVVAIFFCVWWLLDLSALPCWSWSWSWCGCHGCRCFAVAGLESCATAAIAADTFSCRPRYATEDDFVCPDELDKVWAHGLPYNQANAAF